MFHDEWKTIREKWYSVRSEKWEKEGEAISLAMKRLKLSSPLLGKRDS